MQLDIAVFGHAQKITRKHAHKRRTKFCLEKLTYVSTVDSGNSKRLNSKQSLISKHFLVQTPIVL